MTDLTTFQKCLIAFPIGLGIIVFIGGILSIVPYQLWEILLGAWVVTRII